MDGVTLEETLARLATFVTALVPILIWLKTKIDKVQHTVNSQMDKVINKLEDMTVQRDRALTERDEARKQFPTDE